MAHSWLEQVDDDNSTADNTTIGNTTIWYTVPKVVATHLTALIGVFSLRIAGRSFVRQSWGRSLPPDFRIWFLASASPVADVARESAIHGDLMIFRLRESYSAAGLYSSLPLKALAFYDAASRHASFEFLLKTDDDVFLNVPGVSEVLRLAPQRDCYAGYPYRGIKPDRRPWSKYRDLAFGRQENDTRTGLHRRASRSRLESDEEPSYPDYIDGIGELLSRDVVRCIARALPTYTPPSPIADVVTGHAALVRCSVRPRGYFRATREEQQRFANGRLPGAQTIFSWHADRSIVVEPYRNRVRFSLLAH